MAGERGKRHESELASLRYILTNCKRCKGLGVTKAEIITDTKLTKGRLKNPDKYEQHHEAAQKILRDKYDAKRNENPLNSSFGSCKCRIKHDAIREMITGEIPRNLYEVKPDDILPREATIIGAKKADLQKVVGWYINSLTEAKKNSMGVNLFGKFSRGKTWVAQYLATQVAKKRYTIHYIPMFLILDMIRNPEQPLIREILNVDFLVIMI